jgi:hypothetical protein
MIDNKKIIYDTLKTNNDKISQSSLDTYTKYIYKLYFSIYDFEDEFEPYNFISNHRNFIAYIKNNIKNINSRKSYLAAIINITKKFNEDKELKIINEYNNLMYDYQNEYENEKKNGSKNEKEKNNWLSYNEIKNIYDNMYKKYIDYFNVVSLNKNMFDDLQNLIILSTYILQDPRRLELIYIKYKNYNKNEDNYYDKKNKCFVFNIYKTKKFYNKQIQKLNNNYIVLLNKFINLKYYPESDYIFNNINGSQLSKPLLNQKINKILGFKKGHGASTLRKIITSHKLQPLLELNKLATNIATNMGTSTNELIKTYLKKD